SSQRSIPRSPAATTILASCPISATVNPCRLDLSDRDWPVQTSSVPERGSSPALLAGADMSDAWNLVGEPITAEQLDTTLMRDELLDKLLARAVRELRDRRLLRHLDPMSGRPKRMDGSIAADDRWARFKFALGMNVRVVPHDMTRAVSKVSRS